MYIPNHFRIEERSVLFDFISKNNFGILVTTPALVRDRAQRGASVDQSAPVATHLPFLFDPTRGENGTLTGHIAKANPQWQTFSPDREALIIFQGPHTYISPAWYQTHPSVPTWNYATVHAYGIPRIIHTQQSTHELLEGLVNKHEAVFEHPWQMNLPEDYYHRQLKAIVAFEIELTRLEGKFKMSQNRSAEDRLGVVAALNQSGAENSIDVAHFIEQTNS